MRRGEANTLTDDRRADDRMMQRSERAHTHTHTERVRERERRRERGEYNRWAEMFLRSISARACSKCLCVGSFAFGCCAVGCPRCSRDAGPAAQPQTRYRTTTAVRRDERDGAIARRSHIVLVVSLCADARFYYMFWWCNNKRKAVQAHAHASIYRSSYSVLDRDLHV